ncbi:sugar phosphate nucleotidyltransferase [Aquabacterium sp.]|uniref:sugar phosphate nucleotidyltransferase n=1 Tax=Aquabacterium sp. TaxID=1872578 RepID=UPI0019B410BB|nr:hypothetical protein [Aquabacterium sp.]
MIADKNVLAFVMAGGEGHRLHSLTADRCKPSVPFNGKHRIADFVLSNLVNAEVYSVYLLVQYKSQSLIEHVRQSWSMSRFIPNHFITVVPPQMHSGKEWLQGTADAIFQNIHLIDSAQPDLVAVFGADHIYRMDVRQMVEFHLQTGADVSVATLPVPVSQSPSFGIVEIDADHSVVDARPTSNDFAESAQIENGMINRSAISAGARIRRAIIDQNNHIPPGGLIGHDLENDRRRFHVSEGGVVVVPRGYFSGTLPVERNVTSRHA